MADSTLTGMTIRDGVIVSQSVGKAATLPEIADGTTIQRNSSSKQLEIVDGGITGAKMSLKAGRWITGDLVASDAVAGILDLTNSYGVHLAVDRILLYVTTKTAAACTADFGVGAASASYDNLIDGVDLQFGGVAAPQAADNVTDNGANGKSRQVWKSTEHLTGSMATGATAALVGRYAIHVIDAS